MEIGFLVCVSTHMDLSAVSKYFIIHHQLFFPTMKYQKVTRLAFDRAQVLEWVLCNKFKIPSNKFQTFLPKK